VGSTQPDADLRLPNEMEFSISANMDLTWVVDIEATGTDALGCRERAKIHSRS
jgi:hypothetical protein